MGIVSSKELTGSSIEQPTHVASEEDQQIASPLSSISPDIFEELNRSHLFQDVRLSGFLEKICIAKTVLLEEEWQMVELNQNPEILGKNLEVVKQILLDIASLPITGQNLLGELNHLLGSEYKLVISFSKPLGASPKAEVLRFAIESNTENLLSWISPTIKLPEKCEDFYSLNFYCPSSQEVFEVQEPVFLVVIHELIHCTQYLQGECSEVKTIDKVSKEIDKIAEEADEIAKEKIEGKDQFSRIELSKLLKNPNFQNFWGEDRGWVLELQAMVTGIMCSDGVCVSESSAIQEFLDSDLVNEARFQYLEKFKSGILIPFGHSKECESNHENIGFMKKCCEMLPRLGSVAIPQVPAMPPLEMPSLHTPPSGPDEAEIATIERETEELQRSENNLQIIGPQVRDANYHIQDVRGDGNCGFYAILQCLHPDKNYEDVTQGDENWNAAESLRREIFSTNPNLSQMVTNWPDPLQGNRFLPLNFEVLSTIVRAQGRPIIVINSTYVDNPAFEDPTAENVNYMFITVRPERSIETSSTIKFKDALETAGENPIVLLYTPNHWKAVTPNPSTESSNKSSD